MADAPVINQDGQATEQYPLDAAVFHGQVHRAALWQAVRMYLANRRRGLAKTKTRGEVSGGGRKPWKQKHTGRARAGSIRSPIWRGGGRVFGPRPRDYSYRLPEQLLRKALVSSVNAKANDGELVIVDRVELAGAKTKQVVDQLKRWGINDASCLLVVETPSDALKRACANLGHVRLSTPEQCNAYDVLHQDKLVVTKAALAILEARLK